MEDILQDLGLQKYSESLRRNNINLATFKKILESRENQHKMRQLVIERSHLDQSQVLAILEKVEDLLKRQQQHIAESMRRGGSSNGTSNPLTPLGSSYNMKTGVGQSKRMQQLMGKGNLNNKSPLQSNNTSAVLNSGNFANSYQQINTTNLGISSNRTQASLIGNNNGFQLKNQNHQQKLEPTIKSQQLQQTSLGQPSNYRETIIKKKLFSDNTQQQQITTNQSNLKHQNAVLTKIISTEHQQDIMSQQSQDYLNHKLVQHKMQQQVEVIESDDDEGVQGYASSEVQLMSAVLPNIMKQEYQKQKQQAANIVVDDRSETLSNQELVSDDDQQVQEEMEEESAVIINTNLNEEHQRIMIPKKNQSPVQNNMNQTPVTVTQTIEVENANEEKDIDNDDDEESLQEDQPLIAVEQQQDVVDDEELQQQQTTQQQQVHTDEEDEQELDSKASSSSSSSDDSEFMQQMQKQQQTLSHQRNLWTSRATQMQQQIESQQNFIPQPHLIEQQQQHQYEVIPSQIEEYSNDVEQFAKFHHSQMNQLQQLEQQNQHQELAPAYYQQEELVSHQTHEDMLEEVEQEEEEIIEVQEEQQEYQYNNQTEEQEEEEEDGCGYDMTLDHRQLRQLTDEEEDVEYEYEAEDQIMNQVQIQEQQQPVEKTYQNQSVQLSQESQKSLQNENLFAHQIIKTPVLHVNSGIQTLVEEQKTQIFDNATQTPSQTQSPKSKLVFIEGKVVQHEIKLQSMHTDTQTEQQVNYSTNQEVQVELIKENHITSYEDQDMKIVYPPHTTIVQKSPISGQKSAQQIVLNSQTYSQSSQVIDNTQNVIQPFKHSEQNSQLSSHKQSRNISEESRSKLQIPVQQSKSVLVQDNNHYLSYSENSSSQVHQINKHQIVHKPTPVRVTVPSTHQTANFAAIQTVLSSRNSRDTSLDKKLPQNLQQNQVKGFQVVSPRASFIQTQNLPQINLQSQSQESMQIDQQQSQRKLSNVDTIFERQQNQILNKNEDMQEEITARNDSRVEEIHQEILSQEDVIMDQCQNDQEQINQYQQIIDEDEYLESVHQNDSEDVEMIDAYQHNNQQQVVHDITDDEEEQEVQSQEMLKNQIDFDAKKEDEMLLFNDCKPTNTDSNLQTQAASIYEEDNQSEEEEQEDQQKEENDEEFQEMQNIDLEDFEQEGQYEQEQQQQQQQILSQTSLDEDEQLLFNTHINAQQMRNKDCQEENINEETNNFEEEKSSQNVVVPTYEESYVEVEEFINAGEVELSQIVEIQLAKQAKAKKRVRFNILESENEDQKESSAKKFKMMGLKKRDDLQKMARKILDDQPNEEEEQEMLQSRRKRTRIDYNENRNMKKFFDEDREEVTSYSKNQRVTRVSKTQDEAILSHEDSQSELSSQMHDSFTNSQESVQQSIIAQNTMQNAQRKILVRRQPKQAKAQSQNQNTQIQKRESPQKTKTVTKNDQKPSRQVTKQPAKSETEGWKQAIEQQITKNIKDPKMAERMAILLKLRK
eukprot:403357669